VNPVEIIRGDGPLVLGLPHAGTWLPPEMFDKLTPRGRLLADTDWHVDRLYEGLLPGATMVRANFHRYVIDANRPPDGQSLYPGQNTTGLVPLTDFDGEPIWTKAPGEREVAERKALFHAPYHAALAAELERVRASHGIAILYDCHSIRSRIPFLFDGVLPDFNIGTADGTSCAPTFEAAMAEICERAAGYTSILNGRFKGGWTTRHYGQPAEGVHAVQMELAQSTHLASEKPPFAYSEVRAARLRPVLADILKRLADLALSSRS
jgi:N-formylglutamate deformylase